MRYSALSLLVAAWFCSRLSFGQAQQAPGVTFQVEVNYVDVDVVVTDEQGKFVTGLTRDDFEVFEDGKPQKIDTFSLVDLPSRSRGDRRRGPGNPADTRTNREPFDGRVYVIVLDDLDVSALRSTPCAMPRAGSSASTWRPTTSAPLSTRAAAATPHRSSRPIASC